MENNYIRKLQNTITELNAEIFLLKNVLEHLPGSIYWKDKNGFYLGRNTYSREKMQSVKLEKEDDKNSIIGKTDYDLFPKEIAERYHQHDNEVMASRKELTLEEPVTLLDGRTIIQLSTKRPLYNDHGKVAGIVGNTIDITHLIESELRQAKEKAEQANLIKTEFMRNMEHDIRTPFSGVWSLADHLREIETDPQKKEYLNDITQCAKELLDYCNRILDFSKIEAGMLAIAEKKFDLKKLVNSIIKIETPAAIHKQLNLKTTYDAEIPPVLIGDHYRLNCILINLISNAIKFTKKGSVELNVLLMKKENKHILIRFIVADTGIGIPNDKQEYIFEKFSRLSLSSKSYYRGIGLGMRIVKQFMHEIDGEIDLLSNVGKGTQFICTIPFRIPLTNDFVEK